MRTFHIKQLNPIFKYGVFNHSNDEIESHHKTYKAACKKATNRRNIWNNVVTFEVVKIKNLKKIQAHE